MFKKKPKEQPAPASLPNTPPVAHDRAASGWFVLGWFVLGWIFAALAWTPHREPILLCVLPALWAMTPRASQSFALVWGYMLSTSDATALGSANFAANGLEPLPCATSGALAPSQAGRSPSL
jgi:hypothetical protein